MNDIKVTISYVCGCKQYKCNASIPSDLHNYLQDHKLSKLPNIYHRLLFKIEKKIADKRKIQYDIKRYLLDLKTPDWAINRKRSVKIYNIENI